MALSIGCSKKVVDTSEKLEVSAKESEDLKIEPYKIEMVSETFKATIDEKEVTLESSYPQVKGLNNKEAENRANENIKNIFQSHELLLAEDDSVLDASFKITSKTQYVLSIRHKRTVKLKDGSKDEYFQGINIKIKDGSVMFWENLFKTEESIEKIKGIVDEVIKKENLNIENPIGKQNVYERRYFTDESMVIHHISPKDIEIEVPIDKVLDFLDN